MLRQGMAPAVQIALDLRSEAPVYRQIYLRIRGAILSGVLPPGARLPSWNALAGELGVARGTVKAAYEWLAGEGYIESRGAAGTRVHFDLDRAASPRLSSRSRRLAAAPPAAATGPELLPAEVAPRPFQLGVPAVDVFPFTLWARLFARHARALSPSTMIYQDPAGYGPLREAIAHYLAVARGVACTPAQIFVTAGYTGALDLITRAVLRPDDAVWIEDPVYYRTREALSLAKARLVPVPVDDDGLVVAEGINTASAAALAVVTPSHQSPLGMKLSLRRRLELLAWAEKSGAWVIEDDYYGEFQFRGRPVPALKSLDRGDRVLYVGTFSKVLMPSLRLGYVVAPVSLLPLLDRIAAYLAPSQGLIAQAAVADFMVQGHFARHIRRMRRLYAERRAALVKALAARFGDAWEIGLQESGMHLLARLPQGSDDVVLAERAAAAGLGPVALSSWAVRAPGAPGLLLSFANIPADHAADEVGRLEKALAAPSGPHRRAR